MEQVYIVRYDSKKVKDNFFYVPARDEKEARKKFRHVYEHEYGGNPANITKINSVTLKTESWKDDLRS